jgi:copper chaperone CopZ
MKTIKLTIRNMRSSHCQMTVSNVIKSNGGTVKEVVPTKTTFEVESESQQEVIIRAITAAGYNVEVD